MKIVICASMSAGEKVIEVEKELLKNGHEVVTPSFMHGYAKVGKVLTSEESIKEKQDYDLFRSYFEKIKNSDLVLVVNIDKNGIENYIGGNTFLEMGFAYVLGKTIYLLNDMPKVSYRDEIVAMQPIVLHGNLSLVKKALLKS